MAQIPCIEGMLIFRKYHDDFLKGNTIDYRIKAMRQANGYAVDSVGIVTKGENQCLVIETQDQFKVQTTPLEEFKKKGDAFYYRVIKEFDPSRFPDRARAFTNNAKAFLGRDCDCVQDSKDDKFIYAEELVARAANKTIQGINASISDDEAQKRLPTLNGWLIPFSWLNQGSQVLSNYLDNIYASHPPLHEWKIYNPLLMLCSPQMSTPDFSTANNYPDALEKSNYLYPCQVPSGTIDNQWEFLTLKFPQLVTEPKDYVIRSQKAGGDRTLIQIKTRNVNGIESGIILDSNIQPELIERLLRHIKDETASRRPLENPNPRLPRREAEQP